MADRRSTVLRMETLVDEFDKGTDSFDGKDTMFRTLDHAQQRLATEEGASSKVKLADFDTDYRGYLDALKKECGF